MRRRYSHLRQLFAHREELTTGELALCFCPTAPESAQECLNHLGDIGLPAGLLRPQDLLGVVVPPWGVDPRVVFWRLDELTLGSTFDLMESALETRMIRSGAQPSSRINWAAIVTFGDYVNAWANAYEFRSRNDPEFHDEEGPESLDGGTTRSP